MHFVEQGFPCICLFLDVLKITLNTYLFEMQSLERMV